MALTNRNLSLSRRLRRTPFSEWGEAAGVKAFTVYNWMVLPTVFESFEADYHHLNVMCRSETSPVAKEGPVQQIRPIGIAIKGDAVPCCDRAWRLLADGRQLGQVTSATWSPDFATHVAIGMIKRTHWPPGTRIKVETPEGMRGATNRQDF